MSSVPLYKQKRFWTLLASLVAAASAFFLMESCSVFAKKAVSGVHVDTVKTVIIIKTKE